MAPTTWTGLLLLAVAVLPGAMFTFGFERQASAYGVTLADRALRFVAASAVLAVLYALPAYAVHRLLFADRPFLSGQFVAAWAAAAAGLVLPAVAGSVLGGLYVTRGKRTRWRLIRRFLSREREERLLRLALGRDPAPRGWDFLFSARPTAYLRVRLHDGGWIGGLFGAASYAGGFPHDPDLHLEEAWPVDADGTFGDAPLGYSVYVPAATIAYIEIVRVDDLEDCDA